MGVESNIEDQGTSRFFRLFVVVEYDRALLGLNSAIVEGPRLGDLPDQIPLSFGTAADFKGTLPSSELADSEVFAALFVVVLLGDVIV